MRTDKDIKHDRFHFAMYCILFLLAVTALAFGVLVNTSGYNIAKCLLLMLIAFAGIITSHTFWFILGMVIRSYKGEP